MIEQQFSTAFSSSNSKSPISPLPTDLISVDDNSNDLDLIREVVKAADDRKASNIKVLRVTEVSYLTDFFVVVTGFSNAQTRAIARSIEEQVAETLQRHPVRTEGLNDGSWILLDYGDMIVHIFLPQEREFYNLEAFWGHAETVDIERFVNSED